ncbi:collagen, type IX, alpha 1 [Archangium sp. Cb G35]|nr:RNA-binding protein [Archangium sp. Cb G35]OJT16928.1 collagen, type IX, alpha 1 [Archangium sp. Cb G35]
MRSRVERLLTDILGMMGFPARLDFKDASDGSLSVALHFQGEPPPGVEPGKRSQVVDSLQFLLNKMLHRPGTERRFLLVGAGVHPEPRSERLKREQATAAAQPAAPAPQPAPPAAAPAPRQQQPKPARGAQAAAQHAKAPAAPARASESDERSLEVAEDASLREVARKLAEKSASLGRFYALVTVKQDDRARVLKAVEGVPGVKVSCEGEGRNRRVVFTPEKPAPLPKRSMLPEDDDEDDLEG